MLNLFNILPKKSKDTFKSTKSCNKKSYKHYPSSIREWKNSMYVFNKNNVKLIPSTSENVVGLIKSYFSLYNKHLEFKMRTRKLLLRLRRLSSNRFYISNGGFKHTNNKVCINLYVFNRQKNNYLLTLKNWFLKRILNKVTNTSIQNNVNTNTLSGKNGKWTLLKYWKINKKNKFSMTRNRKITSMKRNNINTNYRIIKRIRKISSKSIEKLVKINNNKGLLLKVLNAIKNTNKYKINNFKSINKYTEDFYKSLIRKSLRKIRMYFYYRQLIILNKTKLNYVYLQYLKKYLENIYNKNVEFNIINIKKFYLNSDILSESISIKLSRNRRKMLRYLTNLKNKVIINHKKVIAFDKPKQDLVTRLELSNNDLELRKYIFNSLKYKYVTGFRLEAKGRLSKRFTASRSVSKLKYKGNLLEFDSSNRGWSTVLLKGNLRSNTQFTKIKSKSRIGSFGIKGWVSGN